MHPRRSHAKTTDIKTSDSQVLTEHSRINNPI
jgi:hypothetical protein